MSQLHVTDVIKEYPTRTEPLVVLRGVSLAVAAGENVAILGPSGSGKSTLLYILGTLERPTSGTVSIDGRDPFALDEPELARFRNTAIGFVFQDHHLLPQCSVLENVLIPTIAGGATASGASNGNSSGSSVDRAHQLLDRVGLAHRLDHRPAELSGGERQRVAIARAMINRPRLLLADEPTGNLDRTTAAAVAQVLLELPREEETILVTVTHSLELAAMMQRQYELDDGRLEGRGARG